MVLSVKYVVCRHSTVKPVGYARKSTAPGATDLGTSSSHQGPEDSAILTNLHCRCKLLLTRVLDRGWHELDDRYTNECTELPSEWRGIMQHMAMAGQEVRDLRAGGAEPLARDSPDSD